MKNILLICFAICIIISTKAQNIFPSTGNVGIGTVTPASALQVIGSSRFGSFKNYVVVDTAGNMSFTGKGTYKVGANKYAFQFINNSNYGLFFNATDLKYEFRNGSSVPVFYIRADNGDITTSGKISTDSGLYLQSNKFISISDTNNTFIGVNSGVSNIASYNTTTGFNTMYSNQTGYSCTAIGAQALFSNVSGRANTALGAFALLNNLISEANTASGAYALYSNQSGDGNTATGVQAMYSNLIGWHNTSTGVSSLYNNLSGAFQSAHGFECLYFNTTGSFNAATAYHALYNNTTGSYNVAMGVMALGKNTTGSNNTAIGAQADVALNNLSNATVIGFSASVNASNKVVIGNSAVTVIGGQVGWSTLSDLRFKKNIQDNIPGLAFINKLKPVSYSLDARKYEKFLGIPDSVVSKSSDAYAKSEKVVRSGFIAQDVAKVAKDINYNFDGVHTPENDKDNYSLVYAELIPSLVKAVQELSNENDELKKQLQNVQSALQQMNSNSSSNTMNTSTVQNFSTIILDQNVPNPSGNTTSISYKIPQNVKNASLIIVNATGNVVSNQNIPASSNKTNIDLNKFIAGVYTYFIIADGVVSPSKKMAVEK